MFIWRSFSNNQLVSLYPLNSTLMTPIKYPPAPANPLIFLFKNRNRQRNNLERGCPKWSALGNA